MVGYCMLAAWLLCGIVLMDALLPGQTRLIRLWLGLCAGLMLMMWLPTLFAFFIGFTRKAQLLGLGASAALGGDLPCSIAARHASAAGRTCPRGCRWSWSFPF